MKIVIDSNVWISALVYGGKPREIFEKVVANGWVIVVSEEIFTEIRRVLNTKFKDFIEDFEVFQSILRPYLIEVKLGSVKVSKCRDVDDNVVIETALIGDVVCIISVDKDLLDLKNYENVLIASPSDFLEKF
ncbi:MAG: putative toxin-antitoxin system toxin component, PIN family [Candidatus Saccharimonadales bacterium]